MSRVSSLTARTAAQVDGAEFIHLADTDAVYNTVTASTITASTVDDSFADSANGLDGYKIGTTISISGFATGGLNTTYTVATVASDGSKITVAETLSASEAAGSSVTIDGLGVSYKISLSDVAAYIGGGGGGSLEPTLVADLNSPTSSGNFYTDATTSNRLFIAAEGYKNLIVNHMEIDSTTAIQKGISYTDNRFFFRSKSSSIWSIWMEVSSTAVIDEGWPVIADDNAIGDIDVTSISGWTGDTASLSSDGSSVTLSGTSKSVQQSISVASSGDWISYLEIQSTSGFCTWSHNEAGNGQINLSLGYRWSISSAAANYVSLTGKNSGSFNSFVEYTTDFSTGPIELAIHYDSVNDVVNLFQKETGKWIFKGHITADVPYPTSGIGRVFTGSGGGNGITHSWLHARPNAVVIGDSIAAGHTLYDPDPSVYVGVDDYDSTWMAHANIYSSLRNNLIVNYGTGSETSSDTDARINTMLTNTSPRVVFLHASSNDYGASVPDATRTSNIQSSVDKILTGGASAILLNAVYPNSGSGNYPANADYYRNWWNTYSSTINGTSLSIDIMTGSGILSGNYMDVTYTQSDGVHPNIAGYTLIGDYIQTQEV